MKKEKSLVKWFNELGSLKLQKRAGWWLAGVENPESVAEHSFRAAAIAYHLAELAGADAEHAMALALMHDYPEARCQDIHKVAAKYFDNKKVEGRVVKDQAKGLPKGIGGNYVKLMDEMIEGRSLEAVCARDADLVERALQAKEYKDKGYQIINEWFEVSLKNAKTKEAKALIREALKQKFSDWWKGLKKV